MRASSVAALLAASIGRAAFAQDPAPAPTPQPASAPGSAQSPGSAAAPAPAPTPGAAASPEAAPPPGSASAPVDASAPLAAPAPSAAPAPGTPAGPVAAPAVRIMDAPTVFVAKLPSENPYGSVADAPATLPAKLPFADATVPAGLFASVRVDATGKPLSVRRDRDPIPSLAAETMKSIQRWTIMPARRAGQPVDTWGAYRLELAVEVDSPKITQMMLMPITPATPLASPFVWTREGEWLESRHPPAPSDGTVSILEVDVAPMPQKTPWSADTYKGAFSVKYWIQVDKSGRITRAIPIEVTDPVLLSYFRKAMAGWVMKPAQSKGVAVDSWNELAISGQITFDVEIKQISALRSAVGP